MTIRILHHVDNFRITHTVLLSQLGIVDVSVPVHEQMIDQCERRRLLRNVRVQLLPVQEHLQPANCRTLIFAQSILPDPRKMNVVQVCGSRVRE